MLVQESPARDILRLVIWYPFRWLILALPIDAGFAMFRWLGRMHYRVFPDKNRTLIDNLMVAFKNDAWRPELPRVVLKYYENHYVNQLQVFVFPRLNDHNIECCHIFQGMDRVESALGAGHGCILLHGHIGPTQLPLCALGALGYRVMQIGLPSDEGLSWIGRHVAFRLRQKYEAKIKAEIISATSFLRPIFDHLRGNGIIMMTGDGAGGILPIGKYAILDFMNHRFPFSIGSFSLALKTGAPVLPLFTLLNKDGKYVSVIEPPIEINASGGDKDALISGARFFADRLESYIKRQPYLWHFWDEFEHKAQMLDTTGKDGMS